NPADEAEDQNGADAEGAAAARDGKAAAGAEATIIAAATAPVFYVLRLAKIVPAHRALLGSKSALVLCSCLAVPGPRPNQAPISDSPRLRPTGPGTSNS